MNKYQNELVIVSNAHSKKMIELSNKLEQNIKNLKKERKELEKINIVESQKTSINNEYGRLVKYYKEYKDLQKYIGPEEHKKYKESKEEEEAYEEMKEYIDETIKKHGFDKKFTEELIRKYDNNEEIKKYLEELIKKYDDAGEKNRILMNMV